MNHFSFELSLVAVVPAVALCVYVFLKDRIEREPVGLLAALFGLGAVGYLPAALAQSGLVRLVDRAFAGQITYSAEGLRSFLRAGAELAHGILCAVGFSLVPVVLLWGILFLATHKNKHFNYLFDGVVYAVFLWLGYAVSENLHFLLGNSWELLPAKLLASIPCHLFVGVLMGYYYTMWHTRFVANGIENALLRAGLVTTDGVRSSAPWLVGSLLLPLAVNSLYVLAGLIPSKLAALLFYFVVFLLYGVSFLLIRQLAARDSSSSRYLCRILAKGHPELPPEQIEAAVIHGVPTEKEGDQ